jgi:hypothetical protein
MRKILSFVSIATVLFACGNTDNKTDAAKTDNKLDAVNTFIRATLDGKFDEAKDVMLQDSLNLNYLEVGQRARERADQNTKDGYRTASIRIHDTINQNDSTSIIIYSNSFKNDPDSLRLIKQNNQWLVDLKYLFEHDKDTSPTQPIKDTAR